MATGTKLALKTQRLLETPEDRLTEFPDQDMINGVKKFQTANNLKVDGVMNPGGPTEKKLMSLVPKMTFTPEKPVSGCAGQWVSAGKECLGDVCVYFWNCLQKPDDSPRA